MTQSIRPIIISAVLAFTAAGNANASLDDDYNIKHYESHINNASGSSFQTKGGNVEFQPRYAEMTCSDVIGEDYQLCSLNINYDLSFRANEQFSADQPETQIEVSCSVTEIQYTNEKTHEFSPRELYDMTRSHTLYGEDDYQSGSIYNEFGVYGGDEFATDGGTEPEWYLQCSAQEIG